jgi:PKD repeat protein
VLQSADFDFGDGNSTNGATPTTDKTVVANHTYDQAGKYTITAVVHFNTPGGEQSVSCVTNINITQKMCAINPSVPENSPECKPCQYNHNIPANSAACVPPTITTTAKVLPNTGPGSAAALFAGATIVGGLAYRLFLTRRIKREM